MAAKIKDINTCFKELHVIRLYTGSAEYGTIKGGLTWKRLDNNMLILQH